MDKFLQILEDGRMTDGQGNTVYFSETLIFFTSNAGMPKEAYEFEDFPESEIELWHDNDNSDKDKDDNGNRADNGSDEVQIDIEAIEKSVKKALENVHDFKKEVINRIGRNIIIFDFISSKATRDILRLKLENIVRDIKQKKGIDISIDDSAKYYLMKKCFAKETRSEGDRECPRKRVSQPVIRIYFRHECR
jgi:ATP-dependent Clp protease ATP-binding subunit ClpA